MASMDIFNQNAFSMITLTAAINRVPFRPSFLGSQNLFEPKPIRTETAAIEMKAGRLSIIQSSERGAPLEQASNDKRNIRHFSTVRLAKGDTLNAAEIQNIRAFGSESELMAVQKEIGSKLNTLNNDLELTLERHRLGAIQGVVLDKDNSVIRNWYTEWGIAVPDEFDFELDDAATDVRTKCNELVRSIARASQGSWTQSTQLHALAGDEFFDTLISHPKVRDTFLNWQQAADLRGNKAFGDFEFGGIVWHNYRGTDDNSTIAIPSTKARFYPVNAPGVFQVVQSPAETFDFVNTPGERLYSMIVRDLHRNMWVKPEIYSYPLFVCTNPSMLRTGKLA